MVGSFVVLVAVFVMLMSVASASAAPVWRIDSVTNTTALPGATITYYVEVVNVGSDADGSEVKTTTTFPAGVTGVSGTGDEPGFGPLPVCTATDGSSPVTGQGTIQCVTTNPVTSHGDPGAYLRYTIVAQVDPGVPVPSTLTTSFITTGGDPSNPTGSTVDPTRINNPPAFGVDAFDGQIAADQAGGLMTQAGGHPYAITTAIDFNTVANPLPLLGDLWPAEPVKDALVDLPPGLVGSVTGVDQCAAAQLAHSEFAEANPTCPSTSQVGTTLVRFNGFPALPNTFGPLPVFNMVPPPDAPAKFGFSVAGTVVTLTARLRSNGDYGISVDGNDIPEGLALAGTTFTFWGVPSDPSHDSQRACPGGTTPSGGGPTCPSGAPPRAFLRMPTSCSAPAGQDGLVTRLSTDSWDHPGARDANGEALAGDPSWQHATWVTHAAPEYPYPASEYGPHLLPTGCDKVPFTPTFKMAPTGTARASSPTPFTVDLNLPQSDDPGSIGEADLEKAVVTLPAGVRVSPSAADGLAACSPSQIALHSTADPTCPEAAKIGSLSITSPLITEHLTGSVYLASQNENPFSSLLAIYLVAKGAGVTVKVAGQIEADPTTGQLTTVFDDQPQLPFSNLHLQFNGGSRAPLVTPPACGTYTTHSVLTSWSGKTVSSDSDFKVDANSDGGSCAPAGFAPAFDAGTENPVAGVFTPFSLRLQRTDRDNELRSLSSLSLPPGLLADVGSITARCTEAQASAAACPAASHIGEVSVGAGAGPDPFYVPGDVYLMSGFSSGPFKGDPFGLAVIVHAKAGPYDLGYVVVRAGIQVHDDGSITTQTEDFPSILDGIPLQVRDIRVNLDRPRFILNPTSCAPMSIGGTVASTGGLSVGVTSPFQVGECASLAFKPRFSASTRGPGSLKGNGVSLTVRLASKQGPGTGGLGEANIRKVDVQLPKVLPARLTTLQKACTEAQFATNPAGCPAASDVGIAVAHSPLLAAPLQGPAFLVSHGGQAFPDLVLVLQGEGITLHVTGHTQIKNAITYSHFETVPDAPISSFELKLPAGPFSALAANGNLCAPTRTVKKRIVVRRRGKNGKPTHVVRTVRQRVAAPLAMPTTITAQNGAVLKQTTKIAVTGCTKAKAKKAKKAKKSGMRGRANK